MISFSMGIPDQQSVLIVDGIGPCRFVKHFEGGRIRLYVGCNRMFDVPSATMWKYAKY